MSSPYVGEVRAVGFSFAPVGWALCQGQTIPISGNETLFTLIGTTYGGDGNATFGLPNLQSRTPIHQGTLTGGSLFGIGQMAGQETVTVGPNQYPQHNHPFSASSVSIGQNLRPPRLDTDGLHEPQHGQYGPRGQPASQQSSALPGTELDHLALRRFPKSMTRHH